MRKYYTSLSEVEVLGIRLYSFGCVLLASVITLIVPWWVGPTGVASYFIVQSIMERI